VIRFLQQRFARLTTGGDSERGVAMAMVIGIAAVMMLLVSTMAASSVSGLMKSNHDEDWNAAIDAAYAGVADYQGRLANDYSYFQYGNPSSAFGAGNVNQHVALPVVTNPAFGLGTSGTWATVPGSNGNASYRYEVDNSSYSSNGILKLRATGKVGTTTRTVVADLKQQGFINYLYYSDYEIQDPYLVGYGTGCASTDTPPYAWQTARPTGCAIQFQAGETIDGPVHSNDTLEICGGEFDGAVTTSNPKLSGKNRYSTASCSKSNPTFLAGTPAYSKTIKLPLSNESMGQEARTDLKNTVTRPGCLYTGPTTITFKGAYMYIRSPWTKFTQVTGDSPTTGGSTPSMCGTPGNPSLSETANAGTLSGAEGAKVAVLDHNLVYVQAVPGAGSGDYNAWASNAAPNAKTVSSYCVGMAGSSGAGNGIGYPMAKETAPTIATKGVSAYDCTSGDVFVSGTYDAAMTIGASRFVYVTGDLVRQDTQNDILGLVGTNAVWVYNPVTSADKTILTDKNRTIEAAILSVQHSFQVQNFDAGSTRGTLNVTGSIGQKFRGTVGSTINGVAHGYSKNYVYDPRFLTIAPPKFLAPVSTTYGITVLVEVKSAFTSTGAVAP
jgi:hypothetical protein